MLLWQKKIIVIVCVGIMAGKVERSVYFMYILIAEPVGLTDTYTTCQRKVKRSLRMSQIISLGNWM